MIYGKHVLAIIPARGGSKGIPGKNIKLLGGKPLIAWTIEVAKQSQYIDRLIVSSDDDEIIEVAEKYGCEVPFKRPAELAQDDTPGIEAILHALNTLPERYEYVVLLQPTSPLRQVEDIDQCIEMCEREQAYSCVTVSPVSENPQWMFTFADGYCLKSALNEEKKYTRRQEMPAYFVLNGSVYVMQCEWLRREKKIFSEKTKAIVTPKERSVDIDELFDFAMCEWLLNKSVEAGEL